MNIFDIELFFLNIIIFSKTIFNKINKIHVELLKNLTKLSIKIYVQFKHSNHNLYKH